MLRKILLFITLFSFQAFGLEIGKEYWGFNNKVKKHSFNFVSFEVVNDSPTIYDSYINLEPSGIGAQTSIHKKLFLNPGQKKIVQFFCYIGDNYNEWNVIWEGGKDYLSRPLESRGSFAYFSQGSRPMKMPRDVSLFQSILFPTSVSMTDDLEGVALDHSPDWSPRQKEAFHDWLKKGGVLYILNDRSGNQPRFTSQLADLNNPDKSFSVGMGKVYRENVSIISFKKSFRDNSERINEAEVDSSDFFQSLSYLVKTDHNWTVIYFLIFIYLVIIGPVNYLIGKRTRDWKVPNLFFLLVVAGFSILFSIIGRRGYGEETKLSSVSMADQIEVGKYDVTQWTNIFVTSGDYYTLSHKGSPNLYYSFSEIGKKTVIDSDANTFSADIPLFSSRRMIHRAKLSGPKFAVEQIPGNNINSIGLKVSSSEADIDKVWFVQNGSVYRTSLSNGVYYETSQVEEYFDNYYYHDEPQNAYHQVERLMLHRLQKSRKTYYNYNTDTRVHRDKIFAIVRARTPDEFHFNEDSNIPGKESGWTYYRILINTDGAN